MSISLPLHVFGRGIRLHRFHRLPLLLGLVLWILASGQLLASEPQPLVLDGDPNHYQFLLPHSAVLIHPDSTLSPEQLFFDKQLNFRPLPADNTRFYQPAGVYWLKFALRNESSRAERFWLDSDSMQLENIALYKQDENFTVSRSGTLYINPQWHRQERLNIIPIDLKEGESANFLLRIESSTGVRFSPKIHSDHSYVVNLGSANIQLGVFYGVLLTLFIFTLNLYFSLRNKLFVFFLIYIFAVAVQTTVSQGSIKLVFPGNGTIANWLAISGSLLNLLAGALFTRLFLRLPNTNPILDKLVLATGILPLVIVIVMPLTTEGFERVILISGAVALFTYVGISIYRLTQNYAPAAFILAANLLIFVPMVILRLTPENSLPILTANNILNAFSVIKALILGCGLSALVDTLNKSLSREVTERKGRELQLMHAQKIARYGDWSWDTSNNRFHFSDSALDILPALEESDGNDLEKLLKLATKREERRLRLAFGNAVKEQRGFDAEFSLPHSDGSIHYYLTRAEFQREPGGNASSILIGTIHDITDSKLADLAYRENEQRWRELADSTFEAILIYQNDIIIDANQACEQLLGLSPSHLIGTSGVLFSGEDKLPSLLTTIAEAANKPIELTLQSQQGGELNVEIRSKSGTFNQQPVKIVAIRDISERKQHEQALWQLGYYDSLTGLANRTLFQERLQHAIDKSRRYALKHALLFIDLDQFKHVNDSLGHDIGDQLLIEVGKRLTTRVRKEDTVARLGGDEFAILIEDIPAPYAAAKIADEIIQIMSDHIAVDEYQLLVTPSIGIALYPSDGDSGTELLRKADTAMYHAKSLGRNNFQFYTEALNEKIVRRMDLESELRQAIERDEFMLNYQPKVDLVTGNIVGAEALLRWNSEKFGMVPPDEFIGIAEETGLIWPIGELVLEHACRQALGWLEIHPSFTSIAVNISGNQFNQSNLVETVAAVLEKTNLPARHLELEITEGAIIDNAEEAIKIMMELKQLGVRLSLDDFGTGYSSLNYLKRFPVDCLKMDRSFVAEIVNDQTGQLIADNIVKLAHDLQLNVVAEGVETIEQLDMIRDMGCDELQGYIFSKPLPSIEMDAMLNANHNLYKNNPPAQSAGLV